ncbi:MAG: hypothetical protein EHM12_07985 [Dehalococcoidia bacterium]|nr:MAG: hypothetical protein EHM12_07985 [Dehalococcoidia bacterium]
MNLYAAINEMREISANKGSFSITFMSYDRSKQKSDGIINIDNARLRSQSTKEQNKMADYMLNLTNIDTNEYRRCYQPMIMMFNGKRVELK